VYKEERKLFLLGEDESEWSVLYCQWKWLPQISIIIMIIISTITIIVLLIYIMKNICICNEDIHSNSPFTWNRLMIMIWMNDPNQNEFHLLTRGQKVFLKRQFVKIFVISSFSLTIAITLLLSLFVDDQWLHHLLSRKSSPLLFSSLSLSLSLSSNPLSYLSVSVNNHHLNVCL